MAPDPLRDTMSEMMVFGVWQINGVNCPFDPEPRPATGRDRLRWVDNVSAASPVVTGTWVTVDQVVSLVTEGASWHEIIRRHPELTLADIRAVLEYSSP